MAVDAHLSLAFAMQAAPNSYALLLGAGVSIASGVPSAWDVQQQLVHRLAAMQHQDPGEDPLAWYATAYGQECTYDGLLGALTHSQAERQALLASFFTPTAEDLAEGRGQPGVAHQCIARLAAAGLLRVVVTTNFDTLLETALRGAGVEPVVVAEPADIAGLAPLHTIRCLVVHVHGDYLHATGMLNTAEELRGYPPELDALLDEVLRDYGLVAAGWSAKWDTALRTAIARTSRRVWTPYWIEPFDLTEHARDLVTARGAQLVPTTAEDFFSRLADASDALTDIAAPSPVTLATAVASAKRALAGRTVAIPVHDTLREHLQALAHHPVVTGLVRGGALSGDFGPRYNRGNDDGLSEFQQRLADLSSAMQLPAALVATVAYWGQDDTDSWWLPDLPRLGHRPTNNGDSALIELACAPALVLLYAAGVAATAAHRWDLLADLIVHTLTDDGTGDRVTLGPELERRDVLTVEAPHLWLHDYLQPLIAGHLGLGPDAYTGAFQDFEYLQALQDAYQRLFDRDLLERALIDRRSLEELQRRGRVLEQQLPPTTDHVLHGQELAKLQDDMRWRSQERAANARPRHLPHLRMRLHRGPAFPQLLATPAAAIGEQLLRTSPQHPLLAAGFAGGNVAHLAVAKDAVDLALHQAGDQVRTTQLVSNQGLPAQFWLDDNPRA